MNVLIVQLLPRQYQRVLAKYKGKHRLINFPSSKTTDSRLLTKKAETADVVFVLTKFVSHKIADNIPKEKTRFVNGCVSDLLRHLEKL